MFAFDWLADPSAWAGLLTLIVLEIVLGIDNLVFVAILADKLHARQRDHARLLGLGLALVMRLCLLAAMSWLVTLTQPLFEWRGFGLSWRDLILIVGGAFLLFKATLELHERLEASEHDDGKAGRRASFWLVVAQIVVLDAVFSLDSVITAVGMVDHLSIMMIGVVIAMALMITASKPLTTFVNARPTVVILCLSFLLMIGFSLIAEGFGFHIPKGYLYAAIGFSIMIEVFNQTMRRNRRRSLLVGGRVMRDRTAKAVLRLLGGKPDGEEGDTGKGEAVPAVAETSVFGKDELEMVQGVLDLSQRPVRSIMTPRTEIVWVDPDEDAATLLAEARESPHHWMLVARGDLDELVGVVSSRDLLASLGDHGRLDTDGVVRKPVTVLESLSVLRLIDEFRRAPLQMALVVDEYGSILGLVTPADVLEVIAGEFPNETREGDPSAVSEPDGAWLLDASLDVRRVEHLLGHRLQGAADGNFSTLAGFVLQQLGRLPTAGDRFETDGMEFEVTAMEGARIQRVRVMALANDDE
ncbi:Membrane protein TerC, possibly involved in tellurium resistance [Luteibacter sp. UNC138MFCol5.1]|uniref:TerC family protein n=1 Tax=Luteibacter sp. UNC138MFCol5.1 TaxID=1502774 RepID=UPI0008D8B9BA|nr:TerC family protein [Luteibacter sp. UNC138MFCol5.1]SEO61097.1 Membrane protein TerC, possibly involved in tellurium resistance [Luteibacter sp. UNC138MFCol5.1]